MTTITQFVPTATAPFQFQAILDGAAFNVVITWGLFRQDWYINVFDLSQNLVVSRALVGSPVGVTIASITWAFGFVTMKTAAPHGYLTGATINTFISGCTPDALNGQVQAYVIDNTTLTFPLTTDPGTVTALGQTFYSINLVAGYFETSSLVYRQDLSQFEVSP